MDWHTTSTILSNLRDYDNRDAWDRLIARFRPPIVSFARQIGVPAAEAEDVAQETLTAFAQAIREGRYQREKGRLSHWLFGIAYRQVLKERRVSAQRHKRQVQPPDTLWLTHLPQEPEATTVWDRQWHNSMLQHCLDQVRTEVEAVTYQAFELLVRGERTAADAARELNVPVKTVYNAKHRVLKRVRELRAQYEQVQENGSHALPGN